LAAGRSFALANLGPSGLFVDASRLDRFRDTLKGRAGFRQMTWSEFLPYSCGDDGLRLPTWMTTWLERRGVINVNELAGTPTGM